MDQKLKRAKLKEKPQVKPLEELQEKLKEKRVKKKGLQDVEP